MEEKFQSELRCHQRNKSESLRELAQDIRRLMILAYPGEKFTLSEHIARDAFLSALADFEFELKIKEREPATLDDAVRVAQRFEMFRQVTDTSSARHRFNRQVLQSPAGEQHLSDLEARVAALEDGSQGLSTRKLQTQDDDKRSINKDFKGNSASNNVQGRNNVTEHISRLEQQANKLASENELLHKEVDRLKYLEALHYSAVHHPANPVSRAGNFESRDEKDEMRLINVQFVRIN